MYIHVGGATSLFAGEPQMSSNVCNINKLTGSACQYNTLAYSLVPNSCVHNYRVYKANK